MINKFLSLNENSLKSALIYMCECVCVCVLVYNYLDFTRGKYFTLVTVVNRYCCVLNIGSGILCCNLTITPWGIYT